jgi:hypothetical protein
MSQLEPLRPMAVGTQQAGRASSNSIGLIGHWSPALLSLPPALPVDSGALCYM